MASEIPASPSAPSGVGVLVALRESTHARRLCRALERARLTPRSTGSSVRELLQGLERERADVAVLDAELEGGGLDLALRLAEHAADLRVVLLTPQPTETEMLLAIRSGVKGYLRRSTPPARVAAAVAGIARGEAALSRQHVALVMRELTRADRAAMAPQPAPDAEQITELEAQIGRHLCQGMTSAEISAQIQVSEFTVQRHSASLHRKLEQRNRVQAIELADWLARRRPEA